jgi:hypothetical protein
MQGMQGVQGIQGVGPLVLEERRKKDGLRGERKAV